MKDQPASIIERYRNQLSREKFALWQDSLAGEIRGLIPSTHYLARRGDRGAIIERVFTKFGDELIRFVPESSKLIPLMDLLEKVDPEFGEGGG